MDNYCTGTHRLPPEEVPAPRSDLLAEMIRTLHDCALNRFDIAPHTLSESSWIRASRMTRQRPTRIDWAPTQPDVMDINYKCHSMTLFGEMTKSDYRAIKAHLLYEVDGIHTDSMHDDMDEEPSVTKVWVPGGGSALGPLC